MGTPAICGAEAVKIDIPARQFTVGDTVVREGEVITISGTSGEIFVGEIPVVTPEPTGHFGTILGWADELRRLKVRTNADLPEDAKKAREFGAEGIGLCRTEHMFLGDRLPIVQRMILADDPEEEATALEQLRAQQEEDFVGILEAMDGLPVTVRLLDPPLHEFLPDHEELKIKQAKGEATDDDIKLLKAAEYWREANPMLGTRGCRLGIIKPGLYRMQVRALMQAAVDRKRAGGNPIVEIMIPLIVSEEELRLLEQWCREEANAVLRDSGVDLSYLVGTMVETPRAALVADRVAGVAEFFSFGTNDLTQMTFGFSRDDIEGRFMSEYLEHKLLPDNPFDSLDIDGVGQLVRMGVEKGRAARADLKLGICGEHGGDPRSVFFCHDVGLDYVSCSPYRVPIARLAAAHAAAGAGGPGASA
jgi:pyruvate,orthophosphate dikinase